MARVAIVGRLPTENQGKSRACLGVYREIPALTNGRTAYRHEDDKVKQALWYVNADSGWVIGDSEDIGADEGVMYAPGDVATGSSSSRVHGGAGTGSNSSGSTRATWRC